MAEPEKKEIIRRAPSVDTKVKDLRTLKTNRVCLIGTVVSKNPELYSFILDDSTGSVLVLLDDLSLFENIKEGQFVRVLGKIFGEGDEIEIQADIVQDFSGIDKELFKQVY